MLFRQDSHFTFPTSGEVHMRFATTSQVPQRVIMDSYPDWNNAPAYRVRLSDHAVYYDDFDQFETDDGVQTVGDSVNHGYLYGAGRLF